jgi:plastocyanin
MSLTRPGAVLMALLLTFLGVSSVIAQEESPPRPSHIHSGDCDELGEVIQPLTSLTVPGGETLGNADGVVAEAAFTSIPQTLDELLAEDHALKVHLSKDQIQTYLACGDIGGTLDANGALIVGMKEQDGSGYAGIAYIAPGANGQTSVSVMIAQVIPNAGGDDAVAGDEAAAEEPAAAEQDAAASAEPEIVDVVLTEFEIDMPTEIPAGPVRFAISNNGSAPHNFVVEGEGVSKRLANNVTPGQTASLNVDLAPGTYTIFCPVGEGAHRSNGMELEITVT